MKRPRLGRNRLTARTATRRADGLEVLMPCVRRIAVVLCAVLFLLTPTAARAQAAARTVLGQVVDTTGQTAPGAIVTLTAPSSRAAAAYTFVEAADRETGSRLTGRHRHQGTARVSWASPDAATRAEIRASLCGSWLLSTRGGPAGGPTVAPRFALWDVFVGRRLWSTWSGFVAVDNVFDSPDPNTGVLGEDGSPVPLSRADAGRAMRAGLTWRWERR
jgi:hypothetical protein